MNFHHEQDRYGSAKWATPQDAARAGLYGRGGLFLGYLAGRALRLEGDAPLITIGGAGSGKFRDILAYNICCYPSSTFRLDPKGRKGEK